VNDGIRARTFRLFSGFSFAALSPAAPAVPPYLCGTGGAALLFSMMKPTRKHLPHDVPDWIDATQEAFFITINCAPRGTNHLAKPEIWDAILDAISFREDRGDWTWRLVLAMPDHLHGIVTFPRQFQMRKSVSDWKRWLATRRGVTWQDGFFDHRLRSPESAVEKANYIRLNPVRAGLVDDPSQWPYRRDWKD
jgi:REP element-mobilizing transposase RayT